LINVQIDQLQIQKQSAKLIISSIATSVMIQTHSREEKWSIIFSLFSKNHLPSILEPFQLSMSIVLKMRSQIIPPCSLKWPYRNTYPAKQTHLPVQPILTLVAWNFSAFFPQMTW